MLNKPHASLFGHCIEMNKPSVRNKAIGCYIPQSRVDELTIGLNPFNVGGKFAISASKTILKKISDKRGP